MEMIKIAVSSVSAFRNVALARLFSYKQRVSHENGSSLVKFVHIEIARGRNVGTTQNESSRCRRKRA